MRNKVAILTIVFVVSSIPVGAIMVNALFRINVVTPPSLDIYFWITTPTLIIAALVFYSAYKDEK